MAVKSYGLDTNFSYLCTVTLEICQGHDTPLGRGQQLCEILFRSKMALTRNGPDTDFCMCTL